MTTKKAKTEEQVWDQWRDVRTTHQVHTPHQVKMNIIWYWIKELVKRTLPGNERHLQHHEANWRIAEEKENLTHELMNKLHIKGTPEHPE